LTFEFLNEIGFEEFADRIAQPRLIGPRCPWLTRGEGDLLHRFIHAMPEPGGPSITFYKTKRVGPNVDARIGCDENGMVQLARPAQIRGNLGSIACWGAALVAALRCELGNSSRRHGGRSSPLDARSCLQQMGAAIDRIAEMRNARAPKTARCVTLILMINHWHLPLHLSVAVNPEAFPVFEHMRFGDYREVCHEYIDARKRAHAEASMIAQGVFRVETVKLINAEVRDLIRDRSAAA
jgi:hypothetical protein